MFSMSVWKISTWQHLMSPKVYQKSEMKNSLWMTECLHVACFWSMTRNMLTPCRHNLEWYEVRITMHSSLFRVKRKSIPSHCHWVIIPAFCAALPILLSMMPLQSLPLQWELEREREREEPRVNLPRLDSNWMRRISSVLIGQALMAEQQRVLWQFRLSSSHQCWRTASLLAAAIPIIYTAPMWKVAGPQLTEVALMLLIWKWDVIGLT